MMHKRHIELMLRQQRLLVRSAEWRLRLGRQAQALQTPLAVIDQAYAGVDWLRKHPQWSLGALALLAVTRPKRAMRWAARLLGGWGLYQRVQQWLSRLPP
jgi:hypothetical protein